LHIDQQRLQIEVLIRRLAREPALSPCAEGAHQDRQLLSRFGEGVFGAVGSVGPNDRSGEDERLEPFGKDGAGYAGNAPADVVEAAAATQDFPYDQQRPPTAQHFVGARHGAVLSVSRRHADNLARLAQPVRYGFRTASQVLEPGHHGELPGAAAVSSGLPAGI
jgi:hypothetical protein